jgi:membrane protease YdiL (CAAX protease family)
MMAIKQSFKIFIYTIPFLCYFLSNWITQQIIKPGFSSKQVESINLYSQIAFIILLAIFMFFEYLLSKPYSRKEPFKQLLDFKISVHLIIALILARFSLYFFSQGVHRFLVDNGVINDSQDKTNSITLFSIISAVILAPILEELLFRVHALGAPKEAKFAKKFCVIIGFVMSSFFFSAVHLQFGVQFDWFSFVIRVISGLFYGIIYYYTGIYIYSLFVHIFLNLLNIMWSSIIDIQTPYYVPFFIALVTLALAIVFYKHYNHKIAKTE